MKMKYYVGLSKHGVYREAFASLTEPSEFTHGDRFGSVIGPFRTKRAALLMAQHGANNPHLRCIADAERLAKNAARII